MGALKTLRRFQKKKTWEWRNWEGKNLTLQKGPLDTFPDKKGKKSWVQNPNPKPFKRKVRLGQITKG